MWAAGNGNIQVLNLLIRRGAALNKQDTVTIKMCILLYVITFISRCLLSCAGAGGGGDVVWRYSFTVCVEQGSHRVCEEPR